MSENDHSTTVPAFQRPDAVLAQLVETLLAKSRPELAEAIRLAAIPFWFDQPLLTALRGREDGLEGKLLARLRRLSFVHEEDGRYTYSQEVRHLLLEQWQQDREGFVEAHRRALAYFEECLATAPPREPAAYERLVQARLYHLLIADPQAGLRFLQERFQQAEDEHRLAVAEQLLAIADEQRPLLKPEERAYVDYLHGRLDQLYERWPRSRDRFRRMLARGGLPPDLEARIRRALAHTLAQEEQWAEAIAFYEEALATFRQLGDEAEAALTMIGLGNAYLDLALHTWGGGEPFQPDQLPARRIVALVSLFPRLPLVLYLVTQLGLRPLLPVLHRVGWEMDWVIVRLFSIAARWFHRAATHLRRLDDQVGLTRVEENLARLYLALDHPRQAEAIYRALLDKEGVLLGEYRAARARLGLATALLRQGEVAQARALLERVLPIFVGYGHQQRIAQTQTLLAQVAVLEDRPDQAVEAYRAALEVWQRVGDRVALTDTVHQMEALQDRPDLSAQAREALHQAAQQITHRRYLTRYNHPLLQRFRQAALLALALLVFFTLFIAVRTEAGTEIGANAVLVKPPLPAPEEEFSPVMRLNLQQQLRPTLNARIAVPIVVAALLGYLVLYTAVGLFFIVRTPLKAIQAGQARDVVVTPEGIGRADAELLPWDAVTILVRSDRCLVRHPLPSLSFFALFGKARHLLIGGVTRHYEGLQRLVRERLAGRVTVHDVGFSLLRSKSGWLFLASLVYLALFVVLAQFAPDLLIVHLPLPESLGLPFVPYTLADLYGLSYLGLAFPLGWWFAVQPLRTRWLLRPESPLVWAVGGGGFGLALLSLLQLNRWRFPLPRPDVAVGLLAAFLVSLSAAHIAQARPRSPGSADAAEAPHLYPAPVRRAALLAAFLALLLIFLSVGQELVSYHYLVMGRAYQQWAERVQQAKEEDEEEGEITEEVRQLYERALAAYDRSLTWRRTASTYNSRGAILAQLGRYQEAVSSYTLALALNPKEPIYLSNVGLAYEAQAAVAEDRGLRVVLYDQALNAYNQALQMMEASPLRYAQQFVTLRLLRGGVYYQRGQDRTLAGDREGGLDDFRAALEEYQWVVDHAPRRADGYVGRGWSRFWLRRQYPVEEVEKRRAFLEQALADFQQAVALDPKAVSAYTGMGWSHYFLAVGYPRCEPGDQDPPGARNYRRHIEEAIQALNQVIRLEPKVAVHYRTRAQLHYLLRHCDPLYTFEEQIRAAIADYDRALALAPDRADWYIRRGNLYYALGRQYYKEAAANYEQALALQPEQADWWLTLGKIYRALGEDYYDEAIQAFRQATELDPENYGAHLLLGWTAYLAGDYRRSAEASGRAAALKPDDPRPYFNQGLAYVAMGRLQAARQSYQAGIQVADQLDPALRQARYEEAITDLRQIRDDPRQAAERFIELLQEALERGGQAQAAQG